MPSEHEVTQHHEQQERHGQHEHHSEAPRSRTWWMYIDNDNGPNVPVHVIAPDGTRTILSPGETYKSYYNGTHTIVAPGNPDVVYFKVHYVVYGDMSTEQGPLNGTFTLKVFMI